MSVSCKIYIFVGSHVPEEFHDLVFDEDGYLLPYLNLAEIDIVKDGMSGNYCMLGKILNYFPDKNGPIDFKTFYTTEELKKIEVDVNDLFDNTLPFSEKIDKPALHIFTHFY